MRSIIAVSALAAFAVAAPAPSPQVDGIDFDGVAAFESAVATLPQGPPATGTATASIPTYTSTLADTAAAASATSDPVVTNPSDKRSISKRDTACGAYKAGAAPPTTPDTDTAFQSNSNYSTIAQGAPTPQGYSEAFSNLGGAVQSPSYLGYYILNSYDTIKCQEYCDAANGCNAFNVYIERDPSVDPADACPNPPSTANYKCSLFGAPVCDDMATNVGQYREQFHVVITGSNGYVKTAPPPAQTNFTGPTELGGAIQAPLNSQGQDTYLGMRLFSVYDPSQCAAVCQSTTAYDKKHLVSSSGTYAPCNFFNTYILSKNNVVKGMYCSMYSQHWDKSYSTNVGQWDSAGNHYTVSSSYSYDLTVPDSGTINSAASSSSSAPASQTS
ncbi:MAG: hypothetical protein M1821_008080 [Bathelium mastoideum]|nr:MAG: hypothetical protein M1821_008080 [Bathelium mastoideum]KAI9693123.1 MAG: hypothetical protein M1822_005119 [Bathelium mastoideum]